MASTCACFKQETHHDDILNGASFRNDSQRGWRDAFTVGEFNAAAPDKHFYGYFRRLAGYDYTTVVCDCGTYISSKDAEATYAAALNHAVLDCVKEDVFLQQECFEVYIGNGKRAVITDQSKRGFDSAPYFHSYQRLDRVKNTMGQYDGAPPVLAMLQRDVLLCRNCAQYCPIEDGDVVITTGYEGSFGAVYVSVRGFRQLGSSAYNLLVNQAVEFAPHRMPIY